MALVANGLSTLDAILNSGKEKLLEVLRSERRITALLASVSDVIGFTPNRLATTHIRVATELGIEGIVDDCNKKLGTEYEEAIASLLRVEASWVVTVLDDGKRQNVPDILVKLGDVAVLIECKTCTKVPTLVKKEEAFAIMQKAADFDRNMRRVTLGKPAFDEHSKTKAQAASDITLIEHPVFIEAILRVHTGSMEPHDFLRWLTTPGVAEIDRLLG